MKYTLKTLSKAKDFLDFLSPTNILWYDETKKQNFWIYRGHNDSEHPLIPSLYREDFLKKINTYVKKSFNSLKLGTNTDSYSNTIENLVNTSTKNRENSEHKKRIKHILETVFSELYLVEEFLLRCNNIGLKIPTLKLFSKQYAESSAGKYLYDNSREMIRDFYYIDGDHRLRSEHFTPHIGNYLDYKNFFHHEFPEAIALARHHGIHCRYLDWTRNPLIAAYFSAHNNTKANDKKICVWALNTRYINSVRYHEKLPYAGLKYLHKQQGLFTEMINAEGYYFHHGVWPTLDEYLLKTYLDSADQPYDPSKYLLKVELPHSETREALDRLKTMNIDSYHLMPSYDKAAESILNDK